MKINNPLYKKLEQIGLSSKGALVYVALLELGEMVGSGKVITKTGLHGQFVYEATRFKARERIVDKLAVQTCLCYHLTTPNHLTKF